MANSSCKLINHFIDQTKTYPPPPPHPHPRALLQLKTVNSLRMNQLGTEEELPLKSRVLLLSIQ